MKYDSSEVVCCRYDKTVSLSKLKRRVPVAREEPDGLAREKA